MSEWPRWMALGVAAAAGVAGEVHRRVAEETRHKGDEDKYGVSVVMVVMVVGDVVVENTWRDFDVSAVVEVMAVVLLVVKFE